MIQHQECSRKMVSDVIKGGFTRKRNDLSACSGLLRSFGAGWRLFCFAMATACFRLRLWIY
jgi:hypothetical protein